MLSFSGSLKVFVAVQACDMRKGFNGLYGLVQDRLQCDPMSGHVFLFANAQRNRLKLLFWDGTGLWVCAKRIEKGRVHWPEADAGQARVVLSHEQLSMLLGGIDLSQARPRTWYRRVASEESSKPRITA